MTGQHRDATSLFGEKSDGKIGRAVVERAMADARMANPIDRHIHCLGGQLSRRTANDRGLFYNQRTRRQRRCRAAHAKAAGAVGEAARTVAEIGHVRRLMKSRYGCREVL